MAVAPPALKDLPDADRPFLLNTGRTRDQWHTMTRTGKAPTLGRHAPEPRLAIHPADAADAGFADGAMIRVSTAHGDAVLRLATDPGQARGELFAPIHWTGETSAAARVGALVQAATDPFPASRS